MADIHAWHALVYPTIYLIIFAAYVIHVVIDTRDNIRQGSTTFGRAVLDAARNPHTLAITGLMLVGLLAAEVHRLSVFVTTDTAKHVRDALHVDPTLAHIFEPMMTRIPENVASVPEARTFKFAYGNPFTGAYLRVLDRFTGAQFYAVTSPSTSHVWADPGNRAICKAMSDFIARRGRIDRLFVVDDPDSLTAAQAALVQCHVAAGVDAYFVRRRDITDPTDLKYLLVESRGRFAWKANVEMGDTTTEIEATTERRKIADWRATYDRLRRLAVPVKDSLNRLAVKHASDVGYVTITRDCLKQAH